MYEIRASGGLFVKYLEYLEANREQKQLEIEKILERYKTEPVGSGYIDIITPIENVEKLINEFTNINVAIECVTWWCYCSDQNKIQYGCPHGMGGPKSCYFDEWYSEMGFDFETFEICLDEIKSLHYDEGSPKNIQAINEKVKDYVNDSSKARGYSQCLTPAFWLSVPENWKRINYLKDS